ncbi:MAG: DNA repair protein RecO [Candidatus Rokuibacteriota bacterium]|nr:MAG: DNA repair protein RecO [Candidatus Rokubacteria bacterium]
MALGKSAAVVIGSFPLGESDRLVTFYSRDFGKIRGVAKAARRMRSRFGSALELCTLGELVFFDAGRSELVRVDHFDITHPFQRVREDLERLAQAAWIVECVARLTAERDRHVALFGLLVRGLRALEGSRKPARVAICFGVRYIEDCPGRRRWPCLSAGPRQSSPSCLRRRSHASSATRRGRPSSNASFGDCCQRPGNTLPPPRRRV